MISWRIRLGYKNLSNLRDKGYKMKTLEVEYIENIKLLQETIINLKNISRELDIYPKMNILYAIYDTESSIEKLVKTLEASINDTL